MIGNKDRPKMYGITNNETMPEACKTEQYAWDDLISNIWKSVLRSFQTTVTKTIVEIAPGTSTKVAMALSKIQFNGTVYLVDASEKALVSVKKKYKECLPEAELFCVQEDIQKAQEHLPYNPDFLLLSHVIDDMLMFEGINYIEHLREENVFGWFSDKATYDSETTDIYEQAWLEILKNKEALEIAKKKVMKELLDLIESTKPKVMIISQYPSATLDENGMGSLNDHTEDIFSELRETLTCHIKTNEYIQGLLNTNKNYNHQHIGHNILNARNWLIYQNRNYSDLTD